MVLTDKKQVLLEIIEDADEKLLGLMIALANEYNDSEEVYSEEEVERFYKIRDEMIAHPENTFTVEEAHQKIRRKKK